MLCREHTRVVVVSATPCSPRSPPAPRSNAFTDGKGKNLRYTQAAQAPSLGLLLPPPDLKGPWFVVLKG